MEDSTTPLVRIEKLVKAFAQKDREVRVLDGIDLTVNRGEMLSVVGPSGAGKSTLLHILGTLDLPTSGKIFYGDADVTQYSGAQLAEFRNRMIGFVFQFHHLLPEFNAIENVMMPGLIRGGKRGNLRGRATQLLNDVGLGHRVTHRPGEMSGGEQQRVALARALVMHPPLILADEPTGNLDTKNSDAIHDLFFKLNESEGTTFLIVTHSRDLALRMPRVVSMRDGQVEGDLRREADSAPRGEVEAKVNTPEEGENGPKTASEEPERASADPAPL